MPRKNLKVTAVDKFQKFRVNTPLKRSSLSYISNCHIVYLSLAKNRNDDFERKLTCRTIFVIFLLNGWLFCWILTFRLFDYNYLLKNRIYRRAHPLFGPVFISLCQRLGLTRSMRNKRESAGGERRAKRVFRRRCKRFCEAKPSLSTYTSSSVQTWSVNSKKSLPKN